MSSYIRDTTLVGEPVIVVLHVILSAKMTYDFDGTNADGGFLCPDMCKEVPQYPNFIGEHYEGQNKNTARKLLILLICVAGRMPALPNRSHIHVRINPVS